MEGRPTRREDVAWIEVDGDVVAVGAAGDIHVLRGAAAALWQVLNGDSLDGLDSEVAETFGIDVERAASDIEQAWSMLVGLGIVDLRDGSEGSAATSSTAHRESAATRSPTNEW